MVALRVAQTLTHLRFRRGWVSCHAPLGTSHPPRRPAPVRHAGVPGGGPHAALRRPRRHGRRRPAGGARGAGPARGLPAPLLYRTALCDRRGRPARGPDDLVRLPTRGAARAERRRRHAAQRRGRSGAAPRPRRAVSIGPERHGGRAARAARHQDRAVRSQSARAGGPGGATPRRADGSPGRRGFAGARHGQSGRGASPAPDPRPPIPRFHRLGQPADRDRRRELPRPSRRAGGRAQRIPRHPVTLRPSLDRDDRRARSRLRRRPVGQRRATALCRTPRVARGARGACQALPVPSGPAVRAARTARRGRGARAPPSPRATVKYVLLAVAAAVTLGAAVILGPADVPLRDIMSSPIVWQLRLPRAVLAFLVGGALGVSGVALQALVRNPLADPFLLGLSGGAGLGAVAAIALDLPGPWALPLAAFVGALGAMALVYRLGLTGGAELDPRILLLGGVAVGAFAAAITTAIVSLAQATELRNAFLWLWGGFSGASWTTVLVILVYAPLPLGVLAAAARPLDLLALGEEPAQYLGADVPRLKRLVYLAASLLTAVAVAVAGVIGFVGLIVPHLCRLVWGRLHRALFPTAFLAGGTLLAAADTLARTVVAPRELPVGIVTALLGVPVFAFLLRRWTVS